MIPKKNVRELIDKFIPYSYCSDGNNSMNRQYQQEDNAKECVLIMVDELIKQATKISIEESGTALIDYGQEYWQEVKQEIKKL